MVEAFGQDVAREQGQEAAPGSTPRREPPFGLTRRSFLPALLREVLVNLKMARGQPGGRLADLSDMPDEELASIRPVINPAYEILIQGDQVWGCHRRTEAMVRLFSLEDKETLFVFNLFDGEHRLDQVGERLARDRGWDERRAFGHVRDLFLAWVRCLVCLPKDPPPDGGEPAGAGTA